MRKSEPLNQYIAINHCKTCCHQGDIKAAVLWGRVGLKVEIYMIR